MYYTYLTDKKELIQFVSPVYTTYTLFNCLLMAIYSLYTVVVLRSLMESRVLLFTFCWKIIEHLAPSYPIVDHTGSKCFRYPL